MIPRELLLRRQWKVLREWLEAERVLDHAEQPSGLGAWTVSDLVVHLGYGLAMLAEVGPAGEREPIPLVRYVAGYAPARQQIAADTQAVAAPLRGRELAGIDELAHEAWGALDRGLPEVVLGRRGPVRREDFLLTRLVELVTHGDDLHRALRPDRPTPVLPAAVAAVAGLFADSYQLVDGRRPRWAGIELVRVATGRVKTDDPVLPLLS